MITLADKLKSTEESEFGVNFSKILNTFSTQQNVTVDTTLDVNIGFTISDIRRVAIFVSRDANYTGSQYAVESFHSPYFVGAYGNSRRGAGDNNGNVYLDVSILNSTTLRLTSGGGASANRHIMVVEYNWTVTGYEEINFVDTNSDVTSAALSTSISDITKTIVSGTFQGNDPAWGASTIGAPMFSGDMPAATVGLSDSNSTNQLYQIFPAFFG